MSEENLLAVGRVTHFFTKISVAVVELSAPLAVNDCILFKGPTTDFEQVIELARKSADYPPGSRFKWNVEVLWAVESYLKQASKEKREQFIEAVNKGWIALDALYGNELTALCRPEELIRLVDYAQKLRQRYGFTINSAMITDVPGYTWGIVPVLAPLSLE